MYYVLSLLSKLNQGFFLSGFFCIFAFFFFSSCLLFDVVLHVILFFSGSAFVNEEKVRPTSQERGMVGVEGGIHRPFSCWSHPGSLRSLAIPFCPVRSQQGAYPQAIFLLEEVTMARIATPRYLYLPIPSRINSDDYQF